MRRRLTLAIVAVAAASVALFALPLGLVLQRSYRDEEVLRLQRDTVALTRQIDVGGGRDPIELPRNGDAIAVYDRSGRRVAGRSGPPRADAVVMKALRTGRPTDARSDGRLVAAAPLLVRERVTGAVRAERSDAAASHDTRAAWLVLLAIGAGVVALAALAALLLARGLAKPLERLAAAARRLGGGDFATRAPRSGVAEADAIAEALDATAARLDDLVSRERAFSADTSHQLRTPLAALRIELEALELRGDDTPELAAAIAQVDRLQGTIDTLMDVARDVPRPDARADVQRLLEALEQRHRGALAAAGRPLRAVAPADAGAVAASEGVVDEILDVLVGNAARHGRGTVTVTARRAAGMIAIDVGDEGDGIEGDPEQAFERRVSRDERHGIGLALARSLAHAEGGRLAVTRAAPAPVFTLWLPAAVDRDAAHVDG